MSNKKAVAEEMKKTTSPEERWVFCCGRSTKVVENTCSICQQQHPQVGPYSKVSHIKEPECCVINGKKVCQDNRHSAACERFCCIMCLMVVRSSKTFISGLHSETCTAFYRQMLDGTLRLTFEQIRDILESERQTRIKKETLLIKLLKNNIYK